MNNLRLVGFESSLFKFVFSKSVSNLYLAPRCAVNGRFYSVETKSKNISKANSKLKSPIRKTVKSLDSRKTFLMDSYKSMMDASPVVLFVHYNNLLKKEDDLFRSLIKTNGGALKKLRNGIFSAYLRASHLEDPCAPLKKGDKNSKHPLLPLFKGSTAAIVFSETDPVSVSKILKILQKHQDKLFVVGAKVEKSVFDIKKLDEFKNLPSKSQLQSQLLGLLHASSGLGLVNTVQSASKSLYLTLQSHKESNLANENSEEIAKD